MTEVEFSVKFFLVRAQKDSVGISIFSMKNVSLNFAWNEWKFMAYKFLEQASSVANSYF